MYAVQYLIAVIDAKGDFRQGVELLRGDLYQLAALADSLDFKYRYSSAVISFHPGDKPTSEQVEELIDEFEKTAFSGFDPEQYCWGVVRHDDNQGGFHLHIIIARVELRTGKSFNPAPPGWQKTFDPLRDYFNIKYCWKSPDIDAHPENARQIQPGHKIIRGIKETIASGVEDPKQAITEYVLSGIEGWLINNHDEMIAYLKEADLEISRSGKNYITVTDPSLERDNRWRLKGAIFDGNFDINRTIAEKAAREHGVDRTPDPGEASAFFRQLEQKRGERAHYNQKKYQQAKNTATCRHQRAVKSQADLAQKMETDLAYAVAGEYLPAGGASTGGSVRDVATRANQSRGKESETSVEPASNHATKTDSQKMRWTGMRADRRNSPPLQQRLPDPPPVTKDAYIHPHLQEKLLGEVLPFNDIQYIDLNQKVLGFNDGSQIEVEKTRLTAKGMSDKKAAKRLIASSKARQWQVIKLNGTLEFFELAVKLALEEGINVVPKTPQQKMIMERMYERERINRARAAIAEAITKSERCLDVIKSASQRSRELYARFANEVGRDWFSQPTSGLIDSISFNEKASQKNSQQRKKTIS